MSETKVRICRLCLSLLEEEFHFITNLQIEMLQIILPVLNIKISQLVVLCPNCIRNVEEVFSFKSAFLEIEDNIHGYRDVNQKQVDLETAIGINDMLDNTSNVGKVCRTCLHLFEDDFYEILSKENDSVIGLLQKCLPEMDIQLTKDPVICQTCIASLEKTFSFVTLCLKNEEKIKNFLEVSNQCENIDLYDVVRYIWSKEENLFRPNKIECDVDVKVECLTERTTINEAITPNNEDNYNVNPPLFNGNNDISENDIFIISDEDDEINRPSASINKEMSDSVNLSYVNNDPEVMDLEDNYSTGNKRIGSHYLSTAQSSANCSGTEVIDLSEAEGTDNPRRGSYLTSVQSLRNGAITVPISEDNYSTGNKRIGSHYLPTVQSSANCSGTEVIDLSEGEGTDKPRRGSYLTAVQSLRNGAIESDVSDTGSLYKVSGSESSSEDGISVVNNGKKMGKPAKRIRRKSTSEVEVAISDDEAYETNCSCTACTEEASFIANNMIKLYKCTHCWLEVVDKQSFDKHFQKYKNIKIRNSHHQRLTEYNKVFNCIKCLFQTQIRSAMLRHIMEYHVDSIPTSFKCTICYKIYEDKDKINCPCKSAPITMYRCPFCTFQFDQKGKILPHISHHSKGNYTERYNCKVCFILCKTEEALKAHYLRHKRAEQIISYQCLRCSFQTTNCMFVKVHIKKAHRRAANKCKGQSVEPTDGVVDIVKARYVICPFCKKALKETSWRQHRLIHRFLCDICPYNVSSQEGLEKHKAAHLFGETGTTHTCHICFAIFTRRNRLTNHLEKIHQLVQQ